MVVPQVRGGRAGRHPRAAQLCRPRRHVHLLLPVGPRAALPEVPVVEEVRHYYAAGECGRLYCC